MLNSKIIVTFEKFFHFSNHFNVSSLKMQRGLNFTLSEESVYICFRGSGI